MSRARPAAVRFYFDADVLGLAHVVAGLRSDATYPGDPGAVIKRRERPACPIADPAAKDDVWIPQVATLGWLIVTRDSRIQQHRAEIAAVKDSRARMVALAHRSRPVRHRLDRVGVGCRGARRCSVRTRRERAERGDR